MNRSKLTRWVKHVLLLASVLLLMMPTAFAATPRTVRVGIFPLGNFHHFDESGQPYGYAVDYIEKTAEFSHWSIVYVACENWADALKQLDAGEIDLAVPAQKTPEREEKYLFSAYSMSTEMGAVQTLATRDDLVYGDTAALASLKFGGMANSPLTTAFVEKFCPNAGFTPSLTMYTDATAMYAALYSGEVDAIATNIMLGDERVKMIARYSPSPVYYIARKDDTAMMQELDEAMMELVLDEPSLQSELYASYFGSFSNVLLTYDEQAYVASLPTIRVGYEVNHAPLSYKDEATGEFAGIARDLLDRIAEISGLTFEYVPMPATEVTYEYLRSQHIYVLSNVEYHAVNRSMRLMRMSSPYLESEKVLVARSQLTFSSDAHLKVALATGSATLSQSITDVYPNFEPIVYATVDECLQAVLSGAADGTLLNRYIADCSLTNPAYNTLTVMPIASLTDSLCVATIEYDNDDSELGAQLSNGMFLSVIDKAIKQLTTDDTNDIIIRNTSAARYHATFADLLRENQMAVAAIALLIIMVFLMLMWRQRVEAARTKEIELKNRDLQDAVSQADKANVAKSQFLARMSHEIRTPMNAIVGLTTIAKQHESDPQKVDEYLDKISSSSKVLLNIINDVLDMSAIESSKLKIANADFDLKQVLNNIATIYYSQCQSKGVDFTLDVNVDEESLVGDSLRVNQILLNLVSNAFKFTENGDRISVKVSQLDKRKDQVFIRFEVADTGCGMSPEMQSRLFKPFEQEDAETTRKHGGSGLGLSIAKNLVDMMHGAIKVESEQGKGTTFTVDLPFGFTSVAKRLTPEQVAHLNALIVDDDETARMYTSVIMERIGIPHDTAESGDEAIRMMVEKQRRHEHYDICFIDWKMPDMNGVELTRKIRETFDKNTVVVIVSAYDLNEVEDEARNAGANMFISKPLFQSTLFDAIAGITGGVVKEPEKTAPEDFDFTGRRLLMAEDNEFNTEVATEILNMVNMTVEHAENGKRAVEMFEASAPGTYDLILMDIQMPEMDGYEATKTIRASAHPEAKTIPIYAMTANAFTEDVSHSLSAGMNGHISKPIDTLVLYRTLEECINGKKTE